VSSPSAPIAMDIVVKDETNEDDREDETYKVGLTWQDIAWLMLSDIVGTSVLTLNGVAARLGWVLTVVFIAGLFPVSLYASLLMSRTRSIVSRTMHDNDCASFGTMGEIAACVVGSQRAGRAVTAIVYGFTALGQASYMLVMGRALQMSLYDLPLCLPVATIFTIVALLVPIFKVRQLGESVSLAFFNSVLIVVVIVLALVSAGRSKPPCKHTFLFDPGLDFMVILGAATNVVYSYAGQWMYFELMETMAEPEDFPKAFSIAGPFMLVAYLCVACLGYWFGSGTGDLVAAMPHGTMLQVAAVLLFTHVLIVYLIKSVVLIRYMHACWKPKQVDARSFVSYMQHGGLGVMLLMFGFFVSNMIPFFSQLLGIIGGLLAGPIGFLFPIAFFLMARGRERLLAFEEHQSSFSQSQEPDEKIAICAVEGEDAQEEGTEQSSSASASTASEDAYGSCRLLYLGFRSLPCWEQATILATTIFIVATMVFGVLDEVQQVIEMWGQLGAPFQCHHLREPDRPSCPGDLH